MSRGARSGDGAGFVLVLPREGVATMEDPISREIVRRIVRDYYPGAALVEIEYVVRRALGAAEIVLFDVIRQSAPAAGLREPVRDAALARR